MRGLCPYARMSPYRVQHNRRIFRKVGVPESHDRVARDAKPLIPHGVSRLVQIVHPAIQLYDQSDLMTGEIGDGASDWGLPPELQSIQLPVPQHRPQDRFRACHVGAKTA